MAIEGSGETTRAKAAWIKPELHLDGLLEDLVQSGGGKSPSAGGDGPDPFNPKGAS